MQFRTKLVSISLVALAPLFAACNSVPGKASPDDPAGNFSQVSPGVYRGGRPDQPGIDALVKLGVKTIINLENDNAAVKTEQGWAQAAGINLIHEPMNGMLTPNDDEVNDILAKIADPADQPVYVHCTKGQDRTGLIIALYRVIDESWTPKDAHDEMDALGFDKLLLAMDHYFETKTHWDD